MTTTLVEKLININKRPAEPAAFLWKKNGSWAPRTWAEFKQDVQSAVELLKTFEMDKGSRVAILSSTRYEWTVLDFACQALGLVSVPVYQSSRFDELEYILNHAEVSVLFVENLKQFKKWEKIKDNVSTVKKTLSFDNINSLDETSLLNELKKYNTLSDEQFDQLASERTLDENATIIYTSGTTGLPKGVLLTHKQITYEAQFTYGDMPVGPEDSSLCFLPFAHVLGRLESWGHVHSGFTLAYAESIEKVASNIKEIRPTILMSVPRIYEKIYGRLEDLMEQRKLTQKFLHWGKGMAKLRAEIVQYGKKASIQDQLQLVLFEKTFAKIIQKILGGRLRFAISGGAPLGKELGEFFLGCGIPLLEGYGLTETTGALFYNRPDDIRLGTVGTPLPGAVVKIADDGEILVKCDNVLKEYYKDPESTEKCFIDGYFATGDIGKIDSDGRLTITDRKKDLIKTAGGKYVAPQKLENLIKLHPLVSNVLIHGDRKKFVVALVTLERDSIKTVSEKAGEDTKTVLRSPSNSDAVQAAVRKHMKTVNRELASYETVKKFKILDNDFTIEKGELTPSLKVKRKYCDKKYENEINSLYEG